MGYRRWQVILGFIGFMLIMGFAGKNDTDSMQVVMDDKIKIRDELKTRIATEEHETLAKYELLARGDK